MASTLALPSLEDTFGYLFLGGIFSTALWGVASVQLYLYYEKYSKTDKLWLRLYILLIFSLDTAHQILVVQSLYACLVKEFGNFSFLVHPQGTVIDVTMFAALIDAMVQSIFLMRVWSLSNGNYVLTGVLAAIVLGQLAATLTFFGQTYGTTEVTQLLDSINTARVMNGLVLVSDIAIALALIFLLRSNRSGIRRTDTLIMRLVIYTIGTGHITSIWGIVGLVGAIVIPRSFLYLMVDVVMPKLYLNCVLASLNSRSKLREGLADESGHVSIQLNNFHTGTSRGTSSANNGIRKAAGPRTIECRVDIDVGHDGEREMKFKRLAPAGSDIEAAMSGPNRTERDDSQI